MFVMRVIGRMDGAPLSISGQYLKSFDVDADGGRGYGKFTLNPMEAKRFAGPADAMTFVTTQSTVKPLREDGQPNRPMMATMWAISPLIEACHDAGIVQEGLRQ